MRRNSRRRDGTTHVGCCERRDGVVALRVVDESEHGQNGGVVHGLVVGYELAFMHHARRLPIAAAGGETTLVVSRLLRLGLFANGGDLRGRGGYCQRGGDGRQHMPHDGDGGCR